MLVIGIIQLEESVSDEALHIRPELKLIARLVTHHALVPSGCLAGTLRLVHQAEWRLTLKIR